LKFNAIGHERKANRFQMSTERGESNQTMMNTKTKIMTTAKITMMNKKSETLRRNGVSQITHG